jgi:FK506-binding protein 4/5
MYEKVDTVLSMDHGMSEDEKAKSKELIASAALNLAAVSLKAGNYRQVVRQCGKVLAKNSSHVKALYRRSQAYVELGDLLEAENDLKAALLVEPESRDLLAAQKRLRQRMKVQNKNDAKLFGAMFSKVRWGLSSRLLPRMHLTLGRQMSRCVRCDGAAAQQSQLVRLR